MPKVVRAKQPFKAFKLLKDIYLGCYTQMQQNQSEEVVTITDASQITPQNAAQLYSEALRAGLGLKPTEDSNGSRIDT